jgi:hypothetical protein
MSKRGALALVLVLLTAALTTAEMFRSTTGRRTTPVTVAQPARPGRELAGGARAAATPHRGRRLNEP